MRAEQAVCDGCGRTHDADDPAEPIPSERAGARRAIECARRIVAHVEHHGEVPAVTALEGAEDMARYIVATDEWLRRVTTDDR